MEAAPRWHAKGKLVTARSRLDRTQYQEPWPNDPPQIHINCTLRPKHRSPPWTLLLHRTTHQGRPFHLHPLLLYLHQHTLTDIPHHPDHTPQT